MFIALPVIFANTRSTSIKQITIEQNVNPLLEYIDEHDDYNIKVTCNSIDNITPTMLHL